jgi:hypothetical protein
VDQNPLLREGLTILIRLQPDMELVGMVESYDVITVERPAIQAVEEPSGSGIPATPECLPLAQVIATEAGQRIARDFPHLDRHWRLQIATIFHRQLIPARRPGRKRRKEITAAHADWKVGVRGAQLYRKHIPGFDRMSRWRRESKSRDLMDAIRSRERRASIPEIRIREAK